MTQNLPAVQTAQKPLMERIAERFGVDEAKLMTTLKATAFRVRDGQVTNEQMTALLIVADQYGLNPFTKELYAYPDKGGGIVPVVSVDGWARIINEHPKFDGMDFEYAEKLDTRKGAKSCPEWCKCILYRKDRSHPTKIIEHLDEVFRELSYTNPWQSHTKRMLRHKALIQCARITFGFAGIYDQDEAERIIELDVTPATPRAGALQAITSEERDVIAELSSRVKGLVANEQWGDAFFAWKDAKLDADNTVAFWDCLDSKTRAQLKRMEEAQHAQDIGVISPAKRKRLEAIIKESGLDREGLKDWVMLKFSKAHFTELTNDEYEMLDAHIASIAKAPAAPSHLPPAGTPSDSETAAVGLINAAELKAIEIVVEMKGIKGRFDTRLRANGIKSPDQIPAHLVAKFKQWVEDAE